MMAARGAPCAELLPSAPPPPRKRRRVSATEEEEAARWAGRLQEEEDAESARRLASSETTRMTPASSLPLEALLGQENERRVACEGPPCPPELRVLAAWGGKIEERSQGGGRAW